ncbi:hypothetical protein [Streptomyces sp. F001]|uniref:hypothetical protein n=1 Tax=Streptomyces sp. F001 TaxID=1510026 RepID=UPI0013EEE698|nr:hypothetical protein [Streptomyces sp. F001]
MTTRLLRQSAVRSALGTAAATGQITGVGGRWGDVAGTATAIQLYDHNGTAAQQWTVTAASDIVNLQADGAWTRQ